MSIGSLLFRSVAAVAIGVSVFFASMSITLLLHGGDQVSTSTIETEPPPTTLTSLTPADPVVVATTAPPNAVPSSTQPVVATATPPLALGGKTSPGFGRRLGSD